MEPSSPQQPAASPTTSSEDQQKHYFCQRCLNHRLEFPRKGHKPYCRFAACRCDDCAMVERRRQLNNQLSRRPKAAADSPKTGGRKVRDPKCARCSAHGEETALRGHKRASCPFNECDCHLCQLVENRRSLMARQIKLRRDQQKARRAQAALEETEDDVRRALAANLDLSPVRPTEAAVEEVEVEPPHRREKRRSPEARPSVAAPTVVSPLDFLEHQLKQQSLPLFSALSFFPPLGPAAAALPTPPASAAAAWPFGLPEAPPFAPPAAPGLASFAAFGVDWLAGQAAVGAPAPASSPPLVPPLLLPAFQPPASFFPSPVVPFGSQLENTPPQSSDPLPNETVLLAARMLSGQYGSHLQHLLGNALQVTSFLDSKLANSTASPQNPSGSVFSFQ
ncbi:Protein male abnormal 3 [Aphelenchoides fujianensis]|nr:Protein male abnormal 3 [Aphelenchoides fujianensis]